MSTDVAVDAVEGNLTHIARFEAKRHPKPLSDTAVTEAFGDWAYPKIVAGLTSDNAVIKAKSVVAARELLVAPEKHIRCIAAGITPALRDLLKLPEDAATAAAAADTNLQAAAAATMQVLVAKEVGCMDALQHGCMAPLLQLLKQPSPAAKDAAYGCLRAAALFEPWRAALVREGALPALLMYAQQEEPQRAACAMELLHHCTQARHNQDALTQLVAVQHAVPVLAGMLSAASAAPVTLGTVKLLAALASTHKEGRLQAVESGCVVQLLKLLQSGSSDVVGAAAMALMMLTLAKEGKVAMHQAQGLLVCLSVVEAQLQGPGVQELLTSHVLQAVTNAAEYGPCNTQLQRAPQLQAVKALAALEDKPLVAAAAVQTLRMAGIKNSSSSSSTGC